MQCLKKIQILAFLIFGVCLMSLTSCSNAPENLKVVPKEAKTVSVFDVYSIARKGKLDDITSLKYFRAIKKELRKENKRVAKILDNVVEDPAITGLNLKSDILAFYINEARDEKFFCISAEIADEDKFSEFIEDVLVNAGAKFDVEEEKNYSYTKLDREVILAWDGKKAVFCLADSYGSRKNLEIEVGTLMELKEKNQITSNDAFNKFFADKKDLSVWISSNIFENEREFKNLQKEVDFDLYDNYFSSYLSFEEDKISLLARFTPNEEVQKYMDNDEMWNNSFNDDLLRYFPNRNYATLGFSINPQAYFDILEEQEDFNQIKKSFKRETGLKLNDLVSAIGGNAVLNVFGFELREKIAVDYGAYFNKNEAELMDQYPISEAQYLSPEEKETLNEGNPVKVKIYSTTYAIDIKNILEEGGDVETALENDSYINWYKGGWAYGLHETTVEELVPLVGLAMDIEDAGVIEALIDKIPEDEINKRKGYFEFEQDDEVSYFAYNDKVCFVTNDKSSVKDFASNTFQTDNLSNSNLASNISESDFYAFFNLDYDSYPAEIKEEVKADLNQDDKKMLDIMSELPRSIEFRKVDDASCEIILNIESDDSNSLNAIINTIDDNFSVLMSL